MTRQISAEGLAHVRRWEGEKLYVYDDAFPEVEYVPGAPIVGTLTAGTGHTGPDVVPGMTVTKEQSEAWLREDLREAEEAVERFVKVPLNDNQHAVLCSFVFNVGVEAFRKSTLLKRLNQGRYDDVPGQLVRWNKDNGKVVQGLVNRRAAECGLWAKGAFVASNTVVPETPKPKPAVADPGVQASILSGLGTVGVGTVIATAQQGGELKTALEPVFGEWAVPLAAAFVIMTLASTVWFAIRVAQRRKQEAA